MADEEDLLFRVADSDQTVRLGEIGEELVEAVDVDPRTGALAVAAVVEAETGPSAGDEVADRVEIPPRVLRQTVDHEKHALGFAGRLP